ncbi:MAG: ferrochelatase [Candidatus Hydrogenedentota bacterium]|nr:MAG: ferrochelatase [Candidatus Hydrogenedentota bacterium]
MRTGGTTGVLLLNLGSPARPTAFALMPYLREFLMDPAVIDLPYWRRFLLVHGLILPFRSFRSARAYRRIWTKEGSPLIAITFRVRRELEKKLGMPVAVGMRYGHPRTREALEQLRDAGVEKIAVLPQYPQFASASYETAVQHLFRNAGMFSREDMRVLPPFFEEPRYLDCLANSLRDVLAPEDALLLSFHGVPERHLRKADPTGAYCLSSRECCRRVPQEVLARCYRAQCYRTAEEVARRLGREIADDPAEGKVSLGFQSRLGNDRWTRPYTDELLLKAGEMDIANLKVACPSFTADCLETLEEIGMEGRRIFEEAGGGRFALIPSLNDRPEWVELLAAYARELLEWG